MSFKILITGPESSGKSTLCEQLRNSFGGLIVQEFAREYLNELNRSYKQADLNTILNGQLNAEGQAIAQKPSLLFCDTGPEVIWVWSNWKYGTVNEAVEFAAANQPYDLRLLCYPDLDWEEDPLREAPNMEERLQIFEQYVNLFEKLDFPYTFIRGNGEARLNLAKEILKSHL